MTTTHPLSQNAILLAGLLERLEGAVRPDAAQYQQVARRLASELVDVAPEPALDQLLAASRSTATVYENLNYSYAGLCRSPLDAALSAELEAREAINRARTHATRDAAGH